jgi:hypothetical protein
MLLWCHVYGNSIRKRIWGKSAAMFLSHIIISHKQECLSLKNKTLFNSERSESYIMHLIQYQNHSIIKKAVKIIAHL